jgi:prepilin-type N-terminal cleavage/methylation domain-containing protein
VRGPAADSTGGEAGMTLVELLVSMTIMTVLMAIVGPMLISATTATNRLERTNDAINDARLVSAQLDRELRSAECISSPAENQAGNVLIFRTLADGTQSTLTYRIVGTELTRRDDLGLERRLISTVGSTTEAFRQMVTPLRTVQVNIPITSENRGTFELKTTIAGRNTWRAC